MTWEWEQHVEGLCVQKIVLQAVNAQQYAAADKNNEQSLPTTH